MTRQPVLIILAAAVLVPAAAAPAAQAPSKLSADAAMRFGIRAFARVEARGATASRLRVTCETWKKVGDTKPCTGTFRLTRNGRVADYRLTAKASTFLNTPGSVQYNLYARTKTPGPGLPRSTGGFAGFYQG